MENNILQNIFTPTDETPNTQIVADEKKPVYLTTFKSIKTEDGANVISSEHRKVVVADNGVLIEEVLSDVESTDDQKELPSYKIQILEISDVAGDFMRHILHHFIIISGNS